MTEVFLGKPLNKSQQISDWTKRPLTKAQTEYAILDAYVLIQLYDAIYDRVQDDETTETLCQIESNLLKSGNKIIGKNTVRSKKCLKDSERESSSLSNSFVSSVPISPPELKVVCDNMLEGLCKQLRKFGVDSIAISGEDHWEKCADIANQEDRIVLTRKKRMKQLSKMVNGGRCFALSCDNPKEQVKEVFDTFHVTNVEDYIFSRCMKCNGDSFANVTKGELRNFKSSISNLFF